MELLTNPNPAARGPKRVRLCALSIKPWVSNNDGNTNLDNNEGAWMAAAPDLPSHPTAGAPPSINLTHLATNSVFPYHQQSHQGEYASHVFPSFSPSPRPHVPTAARENRKILSLPATAHQPQPPSVPQPSPNGHRQSRLPSRGQNKTPIIPRQAIVGALPTIAEPETSETRHTLAKLILCPFPVEEDRLAVSTILRYTRPQNGEVNSYVKFNLPDPLPASESLRNNNSRGSSILVDLHSEPKMLPLQFGPGFPRDTHSLGIRLFQFYLNPWCHGRYSDSSTNPWRTEFGAMHRDIGVSCAIQTLAGTYLYDYWHIKALRKHVNEQYTRAVGYFQELLSNRQTGKGKGHHDVLVTMGILLAMHDIALAVTKQQRINTYPPSWLKAFWLIECLLRDTDKGGRFWRDKNVPRSQLRNSQSIIVGRYVILTESMLPLPSPKSLDPEEESDRFSLLFDGLSESQAFEINVAGGCSVMVFHIISQVTYNTARLQQEPGSIVVPATAYLLEKQLLEMSQWNRSGIPWEESKQCTSPIEWIRSRPEDTVIDSEQELTVTIAEMCRITGLIYLQCRLLRLPRNHKDVVCNIADLSNCVRIMPTSGLHFTAQAPLLPVFILALLATAHDHQRIAEAWFEKVREQPVRSHVHSSYVSVKHIRDWINVNIQLPCNPSNLPCHIKDRDPWWESLVAAFGKMEQGPLCLA